MAFMWVQDGSGVIVSTVEVEDSFWGSFKDQIVHRVSVVHPDWLCTQVSRDNIFDGEVERVLNCMGDVGNWVASLPDE